MFPVKQGGSVGGALRWSSAICIGRAALGSLARGLWKKSVALSAALSPVPPSCLSVGLDHDTLLMRSIVVTPARVMSSCSPASA